MDRQDCYMVCAGQLQSDVSQSDGGSRSSNQGMVVGCHVDTSMGIISFTADGQPTRYSFKASIFSNFYRVRNGSKSYLLSS